MTGRVEPGWTGRYLEDFTVGAVYQHPLGRTITTTDNAWFTLLTQNTAPLHVDHHYAGRQGMSQGRASSTKPHPVFEGDTIYSHSEVLAVRPSRSRPEAGIVTVRTIGVNQHGTEVIRFRRTVLVYRRGHGPRTGPPEH